MSTIDNRATHVTDTSETYIGDPPPKDNNEGLTYERPGGVTPEETRVLLGVLMKLNGPLAGATQSGGRWPWNLYSAVYHLRFCLLRG